MSEELVFLCYTEAECERTIDLETELLCEKDAGRRRELMGELDTLWDLALERGSEGWGHSPLPAERFGCAESYYATLFHEMTH